MQNATVTSLPQANQSHSFNEIDDLFKAQQVHALELRKSSYRDRLQKLKRFEEVFLKHRENLYAAAHKDYKKTEAEVDLTEILPIIGELNHTRKHLKKWLKPKKVRPTLTTLGTSAKIVKEPKGVCLVVSPWNYPYNLSFGPMITAIAAGNTVMIKPSEMTPHMSAAIRDLVEEAFEPHEVAVIEGEIETSVHLTSKPFDHIFFTGSPAVGKIVMGAAAKHLTSVTLELGGKSPTIVDETANLKKAARNIAWGKFTNNGQTCIAPDYLFVHKSIKDSFLNELSEQIQSIYGKTEDIVSNPDYCRIVNQRHHQRINHLLNDAKAHKAELVTGGYVEEGSNLISPTVLKNIEPESQIFEEEIFGPLLPVMSYENLQSAIDYVNERPKPLALYIYSKDKNAINKVITETSSGGACVNHNMIQFGHLNVPFGGVNNSGIGSSHGEHGFNEFVHKRSVVQDHFSATHMFYPPYTPKVKKMIKQAIKYFA